VFVPPVLHFHDFTVKNKIKPNISSRPRSMVAVRIHFPASGIWLKLLMEPTVPKPGPTFPMVEAEPEKAERISNYLSYGCVSVFHAYFLLEMIFFKE
jgi:hypothetical protein